MTTTLPPIIVGDADHATLCDLVDACADVQGDVAGYLERELDRASVVPADRVPPGVVTMNARLSFRDDRTGEVRAATLVYPGEADIAAGRISVMTPVGAALIGLAEGQSIAWQTRRGEQRALTVLAVAR
ncbi:MAG: nucleoside diphosphate kinase regulator [Alphaproteobacteria bacterium]|nr:nucleoside diphosphate kinase regulator [Alphaproteobacteria bacterium]